MLHVLQLVYRDCGMSCCGRPGETQFALSTNEDLPKLDSHCSRLDRSVPIKCVLPSYSRLPDLLVLFVKRSSLCGTPNKTSPHNRLSASASPYRRSATAEISATASLLSSPSASRQPGSWVSKVHPIQVTEAKATGKSQLASPSRTLYLRARAQIWLPKRTPA